jgi:hypothetical protein
VAPKSCIKLSILLVICQVRRKAKSYPFEKLEVFLPLPAVSDPARRSRKGFVAVVDPITATLLLRNVETVIARCWHVRFWSAAESHFFAQQRY